MTLFVFRVQSVGGQLVADRPVAIKVTPRQTPFAASQRVTHRVGIPRHVQPMPTKPFTKRGGTEQFIHHSVVSIDAIVVNERIDLLSRWSQSSQVEIDSPNQCLGSGRRIGAK